MVPEWSRVASLIYFAISGSWAYLASSETLAPVHTHTLQVRGAGVLGPLGLHYACYCAPLGFGSACLGRVFQGLGEHTSPSIVKTVVWS